MSTPNRIGKYAGPYQTGIEVRENTRTGSETTRTFEGSLNECLIQRDIARSQGASEIMMVSLRDGNYQLVFSFPFGENGLEAVPAPSVHELEVNVSYASALQSPVLREILEDSEIGRVAQIAADFEAGKYSEKADPVAAASADVSAKVASAGDAGVALFELLALRKTDTYITYSSVYRRTLTAASPSQVIASYEGAGMIWTTAEVMNYEGLVSSGWFQLEPNMQWLKSRPQVLGIAHQKTQVVYTYTECAQASALLYRPWSGAILLDADRLGEPET